ncbi:MAG: hypothetical protein ACYC91_02030 [Solirubrobacteraceae bacterium]
MKRSLLVTVVAITAALIVAAAAIAQTIEVGGSTGSPLVAPVCPTGSSAAACTIILTQVTGLETIRAGAAYPTTVTKAGYLVAWTVGLSRLDPNYAKAKTDIHFLDTTYGGTTQARVTVLKPVGKRSKRGWEVVAQGPVQHLQPFLGQVVQFPLTTPLPVKPGETVALTVPTWAPVLSIQQTSNKFAYRQSRATSCNSPASTQQAQQSVGESTRYICDYAGTRIEYAATEVTSPQPDRHPIHATDRRTSRRRVVHRARISDRAGAAALSG